MADDKALRQQLERVAGLVRELEEIADPNARSAARELVQTLMDVHGAAFERILEKIFQIGDSGQQVIDEVAVDPLVSSLLVLYGLHPDDLETRIHKALRRIVPDLRSHAIEPELISIQGTEVRLRASVGAHACGSAAATARKTLEEAMYEAAPDITSLAIEGLEGKAASGFVSLEKLLGRNLVGATSALATRAVGGEAGSDSS
jgi:Fe-S cluster biogenesis protein NfuA